MPSLRSFYQSLEGIDKEETSISNFYIVRVLYKSVKVPVHQR